MKNKINVLVIEDNEYYGNLLANAIQNSLNLFLKEVIFNLFFIPSQMRLNI